MKKMPLTVELIPASSWFNNVRAVVTRSQWDKIKNAVASKAYFICEICGGVGPKHPVECHEVWLYDDKNCTQTLERMIALCPNCHQVKHIGYAHISGNFVNAVKHFKKINKLTKIEAGKYISDAFSTWNKRSNKKWKLDISHLEKYGIDILKLKEKEKDNAK